MAFTRQDALNTFYASLTQAHMRDGLVLLSCTNYQMWKWYQDMRERVSE